MTPKQTSLYWREWASVRKADPGADRHSLHVRALGCAKSSKDFDNGDLDKVLGVFRAITKPASLDAQLRQINQPRQRILWKVQHTIACIDLYAHAIEYVGTILHKRFASRMPEDMSDGELTLLLVTLTGRLGTLRDRSGDSHDQMMAKLAARNADGPAGARPPAAEEEMALADGVEQPF